MNGIEFYLFRIKITKPEQVSFFHEQGLSRRDIIIRALNEKPSLSKREGHIWHIGNIRKIDEDYYYFAAGRTTKSIIEKFNSETGNFLEEEYETSPYTHVYLNARLGILSVAKKSKLSPTIIGISNLIKKLLFHTKVFGFNDLRLDIDPITDPKDFISSIESAYAIKKYTFHFSLPNPIDVDHLFHKPMENYLSAANGEEGKTTISGQNLQPDILIKMTRSVAACGDNAEARIKPEYGKRTIKKTLKGNPAFFSISENEMNDDTIISEIEKTYNDVRQAENE